MVESDAGKYEVKINSTGLEDVEICDRNILPMLANLALHAPVTFVLQESSVPRYDAGDVISDYVLPAHQETISKSFSFGNTFQVNAAAVLNVSMILNSLLKDGVFIDDDNYKSIWSYDNNITTQNLLITYNTVESIAGHYVQQPYISYEGFDQATCPGYHDYIQYYIGVVPVFSLYLNILPHSKSLLWA